MIDTGLAVASTTGADRIIRAAHIKQMCASAWVLLPMSKPCFVLSDTAARQKLQVSSAKFLKQTKFSKEIVEINRLREMRLTTLA